MIDAILTLGDSARLRQNLVKGKQSVIQYEANLGWPFASALDYRDPEPYGIFVLHKPDFTAEQIVSQVQEEIAKLQSQPLDARELGAHQDAVARITRPQPANHAQRGRSSSRSTRSRTASRS